MAEKQAVLRQVRIIGLSLTKQYFKLNFSKYHTYICLTLKSFFVQYQYIFTQNLAVLSNATKRAKNLYINIEYSL